MSQLKKIAIIRLAKFFNYTDDEEAIVADAEKAFVSMLDSKYNKVKFKQYPQGMDGLYHKGLHGYIYAINYDMTIFTEKASFINRDAILVQDNEVALIKAKCD